MRERLEDHTTSLNGSQVDEYQTVLNVLEYELRDLCIELEVQVVQACTVHQSESIHAMLQALKNVKRKADSNSDPFNDSREHQSAVCELLSEIEEAKQRVVVMGEACESEAIRRKHTEMQYIAGEEALTAAREKIKTMEDRIREMDENAQEKSNEVKDYESQLHFLGGQQKLLEQRIKEMDENAQLNLAEAKDTEFHLQQVRTQYRKSQLKYERAQNEIEECQKLALDLKGRIIEKVRCYFRSILTGALLLDTHTVCGQSYTSQNKEVESKEGIIMELQYKVDDLSSRADGWKASFEGLITDDGANVSSPEDAAGLLSASTERQEALSSEITKLEEKILRLNEDQRQQGSMQSAMHQALESQCEMFAEENADICDELREKHDYICTLEEAKELLEANLDMMKKGTEEKSRKLKDMQKSFKILRQQKVDSESLNTEIISAVKKLTGTIIVHAERLEGFSSTLLLPSTWSENLECVAKFIEHAMGINQKYLLDKDQAKAEVRLLPSSIGEHQVTAEALTPKAKGSNTSISAMNVASQHCDILEDLKNMKNALVNVMSSPKLTPMKPGRHGQINDERGEEYEEDLYSDLLRAHEQLESLSEKIKTFQDDQMQWEEMESYLQSRIVELEQENQFMKTTPSNLSEGEQARMKEVGAVVMCNFNQRYRRTVVQQAFQTWKSQARVSKHVSLAKEMAKEFAKTQRAVLLLKSRLDESVLDESDE